MAKEVEIKIKFNGQELDAAKLSMKEMNVLSSQLKQKLENTPIGTDSFKQVTGDLNSIDKAFKKAQDGTKSFVDKFAELPGALGFVGQSIKGVKGAMDLLAENPLIAIFTALGYVVMKVFEKLQHMKGVSEALEKAMSVFGTTMDTITNAVLKPFINVVVYGIEAVTKLATAVTAFVSGSEDAAQATEDYAAALRELNLEAGELAIKQAEANAKIADARELASDPDTPIKARIKALKEAAAFEKEIADESRKSTKLKVQDELMKLNTSLGADENITAAIKDGSKERMRWAAQELLKNEEVNVEKVQSAQKMIADIYSIDKASDNRQTRLNKAIKSQVKQEKAKEEEAAKTAAEQKKDFETRLLGFRNDLRLQNITDEQEKARVSLEIEKKKTLDEIDTLKLSNERKKELRKAANADYEAKEKVLLEKQKQDRIKQQLSVEDEIKQIRIKTIQDETQRLLAEEDDRFEKERSKIVLHMLEIGKTTEEMNSVLEDMEKGHQNKIKEIKENGAKKGADLVYKQIEEERQTRALGLQSRLMAIDNEFKAEKEKIIERRKVLEDQAALDRDNELLNLKKLHDAKQLSDDAYFERSATQWELYNNKIVGIGISTSKQLADAKLAEYNAYNQLGQSIGAVATAMGEETDAGKALMVVSKALILTSQIQTFVRQIQALTTLGAAEAEAVLKGSSLPFPGNLFAIATTIATFATIIASVKGLIGTGKSSADSSKTEAPTIQNTAGYGDGGMINGPLHAGGGVMINAEGGEAVMTRGAVTMFGPLLSQLNQMGGGTSFTKGATAQAGYDAPQPLVNETQIIRTYVVENELTSIQHKQARLKDLSTL